MLAYDDTGSGPAVVLLHGIGSSRRSWDPVVSELRHRYRCIAVDHWEKVLSRADAEALQPQLSAALAAIPVPVLFWLGGVLSPRDADVVATIKHAKVELRDGGGHAPHLRDPHAFSQALDRWTSATSHST